MERHVLERQCNLGPIVEVGHFKLRVFCNELIQRSHAVGERFTVADPCECFIIDIYQFMHT